MIKCQKCSKPSSLHITEVIAIGQVEQFHLCHDCAKKFIYAPTPVPEKSTGGKPELTDSPDDLGSKFCTACGLKFAEFRNSGRLGCPHDYDEFSEQLLPLLESIHGDTQHNGKVPGHMPRTKPQQLELNQLRRQLQQAVKTEAYEQAAIIRDRIREMEEG